MDIIRSIVLGIIQGVTEFLPVSSSGHLVVAHEILSFQSVDALGFDLALHLGTLLALITYFYRDIVLYVRGAFSSLSPRQFRRSHEQSLAWIVLAGTIPAALSGYLLRDFFVGTRMVAIVAITLMLGGVIFLITDHYARRVRDVHSMRLRDGIIIGLAQVLALIPGVSRSGSTIIAGLWLGLNREAAARFSFLLAIPIVAGAGASAVVDLYRQGADVDYALYITGFITAGVSGYIAIRFMLSYLQKHGLAVFAWYRIALGLLIALTLVIR